MMDKMAEFAKKCSYSIKVVLVHVGNYKAFLKCPQFQKGHYGSITRLFHQFRKRWVGLWVLAV